MFNSLALNFDLVEEMDLWGCDEMPLLIDMILPLPCFVAMISLDLDVEFLLLMFKIWVCTSVEGGSFGNGKSLSENSIRVSEAKAC